MNNINLIRPIYLNWSIPIVGFGQLYFYEEDGVIYCDNELVDKDMIKQILNVMVDQCVLTCPKTQQKD